MTSERQKAANQANALHSTGPKTPEGKAVVRLNAIQHGLLARDVVLPGEDADAFEDLWNQVRANFWPVGPIEELLVDRIVNAMSTLQLFARAETALYRWRVNELRVDWLTRQCQRRLNSDPVCCFSRLNPHPPHCPKVRGGTACPGSA